MTALSLREESLELAERGQESGEASAQEGGGLQVEMITFNRSLTEAAGNESIAYSRQISREEQ